MNETKRDCSRRDFLAAAGLGAVLAARGGRAAEPGAGAARRPNIVYVFGDQWRAQATGYAGDPNIDTPNLDRLAAQSVNFSQAVSGCPVCTPYRASLLTGQYWLTHGVFMNDVNLPAEVPSIADILSEAGYETGYIGKWHLDGHGRSSFIPRERRQGFDFWRVLECTHNYNHSEYFGDTPERKLWEGYDAIAQTAAAQRYMRAHAADEDPFLLMLSWGPPHAPYQTAPERYRKRFRAEDIQLRPNVPAELADTARKELAGYYAHIAALDDCLGELLDTLDDLGIAEDTIFVFTADHGDLLRSHGEVKKQQPYDESIRVPFLLRYPRKLAAREVNTLLNTPDILPTLLGLAGVDIPPSVEGRDFSGTLAAGETPEAGPALLMCVQPFGQWSRARGGREYRGLRTQRHTYARGLDGAWLLFDNEADPYQMNNLAGVPAHAELQQRLDAQLAGILRARQDAFLPGPVYLEREGYEVDKTGTVPYEP